MVTITPGNILNDLLVRSCKALIFGEQLYNSSHNISGLIRYLEHRIITYGLINFSVISQKMRIIGTIHILFCKKLSLELLSICHLYQRSICHKVYSEDKPSVLSNEFQ